MERIGGEGRGPRRRDRKGESSTVVVAPASSSSSLFLRSPNCHGKRSGLREDEIDGRGATDREKGKGGLVGMPWHKVGPLFFRK